MEGVDVPLDWVGSWKRNEVSTLGHGRDDGRMSTVSIVFSILSVTYA